MKIRWFHPPLVGPGAKRGNMSQSLAKTYFCMGHAAAWAASQNQHVPWELNSRLVHGTCRVGRDQGSRFLVIIHELLMCQGSSSGLSTPIEKHNASMNVPASHSGKLGAQTSLFNEWFSGTRKVRKGEMVTR